MRPRAVHLACVATAFAATVVHARPGEVSVTDPRGDAVVRRTDDTNSAPINPASNLPDLLSATLVPWESPTPHTDPYTGFPTDPAHAHLFRLDVVFAGLVNPPGPLFDGFDPYRFGNSPVYGFIEIDLDHNIDSGGDLLPAAANHLLASIGRFGRVPANGLRDRAVLRADQIDSDFTTPPFFERSGADFTLTMCGCRAPTIVSENGNGDHIFDQGETWVVSSDFFQRAGGYQGVSSCFGGASGQGGTYDPIVNLRFSHDPVSNRTTISLVYALDRDGAGLLAGAMAQDYDFDVSNQTSVREAFQDVVYGVTHPPHPASAMTLAQPWASVTTESQWAAILNPSLWKINALVGTCSSSDLPTPTYIWTDTGFEDVPGDLNGDGTADPADLLLVRNEIRRLDGTPLDGEGTGIENGAVLLLDFGHNFSAFDVNGDGWIDSRDARVYCRGDYNGDGLLNVSDFVGFLGGFVSGDPRADLDRNGVLDINDFIGFLAAFAGGCP